MSRFEAENEPGCVTAIMQTLFLLVPVISSTFASIGTFLKDINNYVLSIFICKLKSSNMPLIIL